MIYNHKLINDLAWAIGSPSLVNDLVWSDKRILTDSWYEQQIEENRYLLAQQDITPQLIQTYLSKMPAFRLGHYFENLLAYWFTIHPDFEILHRNFVISSDSQTIGELDFILRELSTGKTIHLEVAVKYYLQITNNNDAVWLGPNLNDNLEHKIDRILNKQIELSNNDITAKKLKKYGIEINEHWVILKGRLFSHDSKLDEKNCWVNIEEFSNFVDDDKSQWVILPKTHWLSEINDLDYNFLSSELHDKESLQIKVENDLYRSPVCIAKVNDHTETKRIFITPNDWKGRALDSLS